MINLYRLIIPVLLIIASFSTGYSAETIDTWKTKDITDMENISRKLSFENYNKIGMLKNAIINYYGQAVLDSLINTYSEASGLYFSRNIKESALLFTKNEKDINDVAYKLCKIYEKDTAAIISSTNEDIVKPQLILKIKGKGSDQNMQLVMNMASDSMKNAKDQVSWSRYIEAIYYFRVAKKICFRYYQDMQIEIPEKYKKDRIDSRDEIFDEKMKLN